MALEWYDPVKHAPPPKRKARMWLRRGAVVHLRNSVIILDDWKVRKSIGPDECYYIVDTKVTRTTSEWSWVRLMDVEGEFISGRVRTYDGVWHVDEVKDGRVVPWRRQKPLHDGEKKRHEERKKEKERKREAEKSAAAERARIAAIPANTRTSKHG